ncbi:hypothetical protein ACFQ2T_13935 [Methylophilus flavus]|uniref:WD40 repeat domain-containing protein n=1 Tax=Methylophilus flavus TaxID=640084 RepID=A0ABW3PFQ5_9PROT
MLIRLAAIVHENASQFKLADQETALIKEINFNQIGYYHNLTHKRKNNMKKWIVASLFLILMAIGWQLDVQLSVVEKINAAFPPRPEVRIQLETLESLIASDDVFLESFKTTYDSRLTLRALTCTQGHSISRFDAIDNIKQLAVDRDCLNTQDDELLALIGVKLVGFRLAQASLKPLLKLGPPTVVHGAENIEVYTGKAASKAGVAVLRGNRNEFVSVEIPSGKKIASLPTMPEASQTDYSVSPNGRVLAVVVNSRDLRFIDSETGQDLWLAKGINQMYAWLPELQAALVRGNKSGNEHSAVLLLDFKKGTINPYSTALRNQSWALNVSESPSRLLIGSYKDFSMIENTRTSEGITSNVVKEFRIKSPSGSVSSLTPTLMFNGKAIVFVTGRNVMLFDLETTNEKIWESGEIVGNNYAKFSEDSILVDGHSFLNFGTNKPFILNVKDSTLSPVETEEGSQGIIYELNGRTGFMRRGYQKLWVGDALQTGRSVSLDEMIAGRKLEKQLKVLEQEERLSKARLEILKSGKEIGYMPGKDYPQRSITMSQADLREFLRREAQQGRYPKIDMNRVPFAMSPAAEAPAMEAPAMAPPAMPPITEMYSASANAVRRQEISNTTTRMLGNIPGNARVEAIGIYETKDRSLAGVNVIVKKSDQPIVLMLSAYEPVKWNLVKEPGANLIAVIATGYHLAEVTGAGTSKTIIKRGVYAYQPGGPQYQALNNEANFWTGKSISKFQGAYGGTDFVIGY